MFVVLRYSKVLPSLQAKQFSAATGLSRLLLILGVIEPTIKGENVSEEVIQRQVRHIHAPHAHKHATILTYHVLLKNKRFCRGTWNVERIQKHFCGNLRT